MFVFTKSLVNLRVHINAYKANTVFSCSKFFSVMYFCEIISNYLSLENKAIFLKVTE